MLDNEKARLLRPKLRALITFIDDVISLGFDMLDNETRQQFDAIYYDIKDTVDDPNFGIYAPELPHLGTTGSDATLWDGHRSLVIDRGRRLIAYLEGQLLEVEGEDRMPEGKLRCFISHRLSDIGRSYAEELSRFLELVNIDVVTGARFEPRSLRDKINDLLASELDFGILIISEDGESMWTRDEANALWRDDKYVIVLVSEGSNFDQGLQGDLEWIQFAAGNLSETFTRILEGIEFVRSHKNQ